MKAYSSDLRERVVRAVDRGYKRTDLIKLFGGSRATIKRYLKQRRETGHVSRKPIPGRPLKKGAPLQAGLVTQLEAYPDATLEMHRMRRGGFIIVATFRKRQASSLKNLRFPERVAQQREGDSRCSNFGGEGA